MRMAIIVPCAELQMQTAGLARMLLEPALSESVTLLRRDMDCAPNPIVIGTPRQFLELCQDSRQGEEWTNAMAWLDIVVVDEADKLVAKWNRYMRKKRARTGRVDPAMELLTIIRGESERWRRDFQLIAASATINRRTERNLRISSGQSMTLCRSAGAPMPENASGHDQYGDGTTTIPEGLTHTVRIVDHFRFPLVMQTVTQTIRELNAQKLLVILCTRDDPASRVAAAEFGLNPVASWLRYRLEDFGFIVDTCSKAVETAANMWNFGGTVEELRGSGGRQEVIVASSSSIRGVHLANVEAVLIVGDPLDVSDYFHCAGRTCRHQIGQEQPSGGTVVSIVTDSIATRLFGWSNLMGFGLLEVPLNKQHPPVHECDKQEETEEELIAPASEMDLADEDDIDEEEELDSDARSLENFAAVASQAKDPEDKDSSDLASFGAWS